VPLAPLATYSSGSRTCVFRREDAGLLAQTPFGVQCFSSCSALLDRVVSRRLLFKIVVDENSSPIWACRPQGRVPSSASCRSDVGEEDMLSLRPSAVGVVIYAPSPYPRRWTSPVCSFPPPNLAPLGPKTGWSSQSNEYARNHRGHSHLSRDQPGTLVDAAVFVAPRLTSEPCPGAFGHGLLAHVQPGTLRGHGCSL
jgi:hypothetical protein